MSEVLHQSLNPRDYVQLSGPLFEAVQLGRIFPDSKTFVDCTARRDPGYILRQYELQRGQKNFNLEAFVSNHFDSPIDAGPTSMKIPPVEDLDTYIDLNWSSLTRQADATDTEGSTLIPLSKPYIVPGGRFREIYYWDSLITAAGLIRSGKIDMVVNMCDNFAELIDKVGFIPNGNRVYYTTRTQPPVFALMVELLAQNGQPVDKYLPQLEKEYQFLTKGSDNLHHEGDADEGVVMTKDRIILARNYDTGRRPREESHFEDYTNAQAISPEGRERFYLDLRAAASSGWDFSSRWFRDGHSILTIHTTDIIPIDKNCLVYSLEKLLAKLYQNKGDIEQSAKYSKLAENRKFAVQELFWSSKDNFFHDYDFVEGKLTDSLSMAVALPLFMGIATDDQAALVAKQLETKFLKKAGFTATLQQTGEQWDHPNGWPPSQWFAINGLRRYGYDKLADLVTNGWLQACENNYQMTGGMYEKYNVVNPYARAQGGEYPTQIGFGWTFGAYKDLKARKAFIPTATL